MNMNKDKFYIIPEWEFEDYPSFDSLEEVKEYIQDNVLFLADRYNIEDCAKFFAISIQDGYKIKISPVVEHIQESYTF